ncbi:MAG: FAD-dependent oxidoreductase [Armatimonadota bacterium]
MIISEPTTIYTERHAGQGVDDQTKSTRRVDTISGGHSSAKAILLIEAESFAQYGGWVLDSQFMAQMGSPYLLAHGLGEPVADAVTRVRIPAAGAWRVWVRTVNWVQKFGAPGAPGRFLLLVHGEPLAVEFGTHGTDWHWQDGGSVTLPAEEVELRLHDLTGFDGRCDAILLSCDPVFQPPDAGPELEALRRQLLDTAVPVEGGAYAFIVCGGGLAGMAAAVAAAREGVQTLLLHDRPVWGGNFSSEVRVTANGGLDGDAFPGLGRIVKELTACRLLDEEIAAVLEREPYLTARAGWRVTAADVADGYITAVIAEEVRTGLRMRYAGTLFADCTGDAELGFLAGADSRMGREGRAETGEPMAPPRADQQVMGMTLLWTSVETEHEQAFPDCPWAVPVDDRCGLKATAGSWNWETGFYRDQVREAEYIRDYALRVIYGTWAWQKHHSPHAMEFRRRRLDWVGHVCGKRESRRLLGDVILREQDIREKRVYPDACVLSTWGIDVHIPDRRHEAEFAGEPWLADALWQNPQHEIYSIPYRCLYSRNLANLFMAGRNISVTHVALGQVRVQHTTGLMGEVVGIAAAVATRHGALPRELFPARWAELREAFCRGAES